MRKKEVIQWKKHVKRLQQILACHDRIIASVSMMLLPDDIIMLIIEKLQIELQPQFLSALKVCVDSITDCDWHATTYQEIFSARQNAIYEMALVMCVHRKVSSWHLNALPFIMQTFTRKLNELLSINQEKQSSVRQKKRQRQLVHVQRIWNKSIHQKIH